jgi:hypothetical protein
MGKHKGLLIISALIFLSTPQICAAYSADLSLSESSIHFSKNTFLEGNAVRIYATISNNSNNDLLGTVQFIDESAGTQIGSDQTISIFANKTDDIFVDWIPAFEGQHVISINIDPWLMQNDDPSNNNARKTVMVLQDTDHDGITDSEDDDDDNDGVLDNNDVFPTDASEWIDTDGDRVGDNSDEDDDNDGHADEEDAFPFDSMEWEDIDEDGIGNNQDNDDDNDGLSDEKEAEIGTDPVKADSDEDGSNDGEDDFPLDVSEQIDFDKDGVGDNSDEDDDNDGILDEEDVDDHNKGPIIIIDGDKHFAFLNRELNLNAKNSFDEDGNIEQIQWIIDDKEAKLGNVLSYTFAELGDHTIKVIALDDKNESREVIFALKVYNLDLYMKIALGGIIIFLAILILLKYSLHRDEQSLTKYFKK